MKLYIKQCKSADERLFTIFDELGFEKYAVKGGKSCILILNRDGAEVLKIRQLPLVKICAYSMRSKKGSVKFFMNPVKNNCYYYGTAWHFSGDITSKSFSIIDADNSVVAFQDKSFLNGKSAFVLEIKREQNEAYCVGTAVCVDMFAKVDSLCAQTV